MIEYLNSRGTGAFVTSHNCFGPQWSQVGDCRLSTLDFTRSSRDCIRYLGPVLNTRSVKMNLDSVKLRCKFNWTLLSYGSSCLDTTFSLSLAHQWYKQFGDVIGKRCLAWFVDAPYVSNPSPCRSEGFYCISWSWIIHVHQFICV